ncbi:DUF308 domain-containing protein [Micromonospora sp. CPCC 206061]|uniref:DUF308 domain-containing protein n=1 Tax=Micromonospora sp. CPCC 206061 TaxID=3122410 RepID=UPI002FEF70FB
MLILLVTVGIVLTGVTELAAARTSPTPQVAVAAGIGWLAAGAAILVWPGLTIGVLTAIVGASLLVGGLVKVVEALRGNADERASALPLGAASAVLGVLALVWPDVTVL